jgi:isopenicillin N synthase-like dioxygenase
MPSLPTVDFSAFMSDEGVVVGDEPTAVQLSCAARINEACRDDTGFLYMTNFGITDEDVADAFSKSAALFALGDDEKAKLNPYDPVTNLGFSAFASEALNARRPADLREGFKYKNNDVFDNVMRGTPAGFAETCEGFYRKCLAAARRIAVACALALELPSDDSRFFERNFEVVDQCTLQFLHFPPVDAADAVNDDDIATQLRVGEHTDFGMVTLLFHDSVVNGAGLQVKKAATDQVGGAAGGEFDGAEWVEAPGRGGATAVVNTGALMARWTNDEWRATAHRVVAGPPEVASRDRYSIAFFFDPDKDAIIETHPSCLARTGREARYAPISARDFVMMKIMEMQKTASEAGVKAAY